jgi:hypothetical protein
MERAAEKVTPIVQLVTVVVTGITRVTVKPPAQALEMMATLEQDPVPLVVTGAAVTGAAVGGAAVVLLASL